MQGDAEGKRFELVHKIHSEKVLIICIEVSEQHNWPDKHRVGSQNMDDRNFG